jgi:rod shape-determining protein MreD
MSLYAGLPLFAILITLQTTVVQAIVPYIMLHPNLILLAVIVCATKGGPRAGAAWGAFGGLLIDLSSAGTLGSATIALAVAGALGGLAHGLPVMLPQLVPLVAAALGTVVFTLIYMLLLHLAGWDFHWIITIYEVILPSALINLIAMPLIYPLVGRLHKRHGSQPEFGF